MYICSCSAVTEAEIVDAIWKGTQTVPELMARIGVCAGCGTCELELVRIIDRELEKKYPAIPAAVRHGIFG